MRTHTLPAFAALLRRYRLAAGLTQEALAARANLSVRAVSDLERGVKRRPHRETVALLATALGLEGPERTGFETARGRDTTTPDPRPNRAPGAADPADAYLPLVGRADELHLLERHLAGDGPPVLVLAGEPGIGKTRLLQEAMRRAVGRGWTVVHGGCQRRDGQEPFAPLLEALARHLRRQPARRQRTDLQGCAWLVPLLPELVGGPIEPLPAWQLAPGQERRLMFGAVERFLTNIAGAAGTLLVLDDLQWAGPDALDLLAALVWSAQDMPLRVICAYRDTELHPDTPLGALLADLARATLTTHHALQPLSAAEMDELLGHLLAQVGADPAALRERLPRQLGGVPFFLVSYVQGLDAHAPDHQSGVPWTLFQSLRQRMAALPEAGPEIVSAAAVLGRVAARPVLQAMVGRPDGEMEAALEAICRARLLEEEGRGAYRFAHDIIREVIEADLSAARRVALHRRAAEALEAQLADGTVEALAYHCEQGEIWAKALAHLVRAGDQARAACAGQAAADYYLRAYVASAHLGDAGLPSALDVARKRGFIHLDRGNAAEAMLAFMQMGDAAQRLGDQRRYEMAAAYRVQAVREARRFEAAEQALRAALGVTAEGYEDVAFAASIWLVSTLITGNHRLGYAALPLQTALALGWLYGELQDHERAIDLILQGLQTAMMQKTPDPEREYIARLNLADSLIALGRLDEAEAQLRIVELAVQRPPVHDHHALRQCRQHLWLSYGELWLARGEGERAAGFARASLELAESSGSKKHIVNARRLCGQILLAQGRPSEAVAEIEAAVAMARQAGNPPQLWKTLAVYGDALQAQGRSDQARQAYRESLRIIEAIATALDEPSVRGTFLHAAPVDRIRQLAGQGDRESPPQK
jgi:transcriptional regulator with XRE-family HTH domain/tetratricopeptide (TPR) repeat protein